MTESRNMTKNEKYAHRVNKNINKTLIKKQPQVGTPSLAVYKPIRDTGIISIYQPK